MWVATHGGTYEQYLFWCDRREVPRRFTRQYYKRWIANHRPAIKEERIRQQAAVITESVMVRGKRLNLLEEDLARITKLLTGDVEPKLAIALLEQKRKTLEQIAKERGEWLTRPEGIGPSDLDVARANRDALVALRDAMRKKELPPPNGEVITVESTPIFDQHSAAVSSNPTKDSSADRNP